jgi:hypothetical protein
MLRSILRQLTGCREDSAVEDVIGRATWSPIPSPQIQSERYATIREYDNEQQQQVNIDIIFENLLFFVLYFCCYCH